MLLGIPGLDAAWRREGLSGEINLFFELTVLVLLQITKPLTEDLPWYAAPYILALTAAFPGILFLAAWPRSQRPPAAAGS